MRVPGFLAAQVSVWHVLVLNAMTMVMVAVVVVGVTVAGAAGPASFRPVGSVRMANAHKTAATLVKGSDLKKAILSVAFTVPSGKVADIQVTYQGELAKASSSLVGMCLGELRLDSPTGSLLAPGQQLLLDGGVSTAFGGSYTVTGSLQGSRDAIPSGSHRVYFVAETGGVGCYYRNNSIFLLADIRGK